jgi:hypothetical protein
MKTILSFVIGVALFAAAAAQGVDCTALIVNNSFEYAWEGQRAQSGINGWFNNTWRPWKAADASHQRFYGWEVTDWNFKTPDNTSQSLGSDANPRDQTFDIAIFGNKRFGELWELYQVIDKDALSAGTYKVQARLSVNSASRTSERLFANASVQYHGIALQYALNQTPGERATFAGHPGTSNKLEEMTVYATIGEGDSLKIGIRTGGKKADGTMVATDAGSSGTLQGSFKADYFRLTKLDAADPAIADAALASLSVDNGTLTPDFDPATTGYTCTLPAGTSTATPQATAHFEGATVDGATAVDVSSGAGVSVITVTAIDGVTTRTYTVNYAYAVAGAEDLTALIVNNSFEYAWEGQRAQSDIDGWFENTWRPWKAVDASHQRFYGWEVSDWNFKTPDNTSQSLGSDANPRDEAFDIAIFGDKRFGEFWELYQVIDKDALSAGTYKVQARLSVNTASRTSERLFANASVQYHGAASQYALNQTPGERATFAGHPGSFNVLEEMTVYATIGEGDSLKIGVRTGGKKADGTMVATNAGSAGILQGSFKADYFRLTKLAPADPAIADAALASLSVDNGTLTPDFDAATTGYTCTLPAGTSTATPQAIAHFEGATVDGATAVDVSSGEGVSVITVTAIDGVTTRTYTVNYEVTAGTGIDRASATPAYSLLGNVLTATTGRCSVYCISGRLIADLSPGTSQASVRLSSGLYIVRTDNGSACKIVR